MAELEKMGEFVRSASSTIEAPVVRRLKEQFSGGAKQGRQSDRSGSGDGRPAQPPVRRDQQGRDQGPRGDRGPRPGGPGGPGAGGPGAGGPGAGAPGSGGPGAGTPGAGGPAGVPAGGPSVRPAAPAEGGRTGSVPGG